MCVVCVFRPDFWNKFGTNLEQRLTPTKRRPNDEPLPLPGKQSKVQANGSAGDSSSSPEDSPPSSAGSSSTGAARFAATWLAFAVAISTVQSSLGKKARRFCEVLGAWTADHHGAHARDVATAPVRHLCHWRANLAAARRHGRILDARKCHGAG